MEEERMRKEEEAAAKLKERMEDRRSYVGSYVPS